eukprot:scaffold38184_cov15-Tisochrysis_lutea.AAC.1
MMNRHAAADSFADGHSVNCRKHVSSSVCPATVLEKKTCPGTRHSWSSKPSPFSYCKRGATLSTWGHANLLLLHMPLKATKGLLKGWHVLSKSLSGCIYAERTQALKRASGHGARQWQALQAPPSHSDSQHHLLSLPLRTSISA